MTYSNSKARRPSSSSSPIDTDLANANDTDFAGFAPAFQAVVGILLDLLSRACAAFGESLRSGCPLDSKRVKLLVMMMATIVTALKGSRLEKVMFLKKIFAKHNERLDRIYARYLKWRQRKMWMWGGGFMQASLGDFRMGRFSAGDRRSYDALIPD